MKIFHSVINRGMAHITLNGDNIVALLKQKNSKGMPGAIKRNVFINPRIPDPTSQKPINLTHSGKVWKE